MNFSSFDTAIGKVYVPLWSKYRPAILQLMKATADGPQQYKLFSHEFKSLNPKEKKGYSFTLQAFEGKAQNSIKNSTIAQDLLYVLEGSEKASGLMKVDAYEFSLDKQFVFRVKKLVTAPVEPEVV
ncbi:MAG: hypothetical protein K2U26_17590 [Cyclobacteriaceae bacterium]|nr:hypothetical protein [Cyclobacteriaceae bacterium]